MVNQRGLRLEVAHAWGLDADERVETVGAEALRGLQGVAHRRGELILSARDAASPALAGLPVTRRGVEQHQLQPQLLYQSGNALAVEHVDEQDLDAREAGLRGGAEALVHVELGPQH